MGKRQRLYLKGLLNIKEKIGSWRTDIRFNQISEEDFEKDHENEVYSHPKKKLIKMFQDVFKEGMEPFDRLYVPSVKIPLIPDHKSVPVHTAKVPLATPRYLELAARKEQARIIKSGALEEVSHPMRWYCKAFIVQKPGSSDDDTSVKLINNMKPVNPTVEKVGHPMEATTS